MDVSSISSSSATYRSTLLSDAKQRRADFDSIGGALQSNDLASAQTAFAAFLQDQKGIMGLRQAQTGSSTGQGAPFANDFQALQSALDSGDLTKAKAAYEVLQHLQATHGHSRHHRQPVSVQAPTTSPSSEDGDPLLDVQA